MMTPAQRLTRAAELAGEVRQLLEDARPGLRAEAIMLARRLDRIAAAEVLAAEPHEHRWTCSRCGFVADTAPDVMGHYCSRKRRRDYAVKLARDAQLRREQDWRKLP